MDNPTIPPELPPESGINANPTMPIPQQTEVNPAVLSTQQALELLMQNPVSFIQQLINRSAESYLADLKEEAELRGALHAFRKANPDIGQFEPFILQEVARLIQTDPDGIIDPWHILLEKAKTGFSKNFQDMLESEAMKKRLQPTENTTEPPFMEGAANRVLTEMPPSFTREQIANMSLADFLKHETAINDALANKRIR